MDTELGSAGRQARAQAEQRDLPAERFRVAWAELARAAPQAFDPRLAQIDVDDTSTAALMLLHAQRRSPQSLDELDPSRIATIGWADAARGRLAQISPFGGFTEPLQWLVLTGDGPLGRYLEWMEWAAFTMPQVPALRRTAVVRAEAVGRIPDEKWASLIVHESVHAELAVAADSKPAAYRRQLGVRVEEFTANAVTEWALVDTEHAAPVDVRGRVRELAGSQGYRELVVAGEREIGPVDSPEAATRTLDLARRSLHSDDRRLAALLNDHSGRERSLGDWLSALPSVDTD